MKESVETILRGCCKLKVRDRWSMPKIVEWLRKICQLNDTKKLTIVDGASNVKCRTKNFAKVDSSACDSSQAGAHMNLEFHDFANWKPGTIFNIRGRKFVMGGRMKSNNNAVIMEELQSRSDCQESMQVVSVSSESVCDSGQSRAQKTQPNRYVQSKRNSDNADFIADQNEMSVMSISTPIESVLRQSQHLQPAYDHSPSEPSLLNFGFDLNHKSADKTNSQTTALTTIDDYRDHAPSQRSITCTDDSLNQVIVDSEPSSSSNCVY